MFINIIMDEKWKPLKIKNKIIPKYFISTGGRIYSEYKNRIILPARHSQGYLHITLKINGSYKKLLVHRLVAYTFIENNDTRKNVINHKDGEKMNNNIDNLEWVTHIENVRHSVKMGLNNCSNIFKEKYKGYGNPNAKYSDEIIHFICKGLQNNETSLNIAIETIKCFNLETEVRQMVKYINGKIKGRRSRLEISNEYTFI